MRLGKTLRTAHPFLTSNSILARHSLRNWRVCQILLSTSGRIKQSNAKLDTTVSNGSIRSKTCHDPNQMLSQFLIIRIGIPLYTLRTLFILLFTGIAAGERPFTLASDTERISHVSDQQLLFIDCFDIEVINQMRSGNHGNLNQQRLLRLENVYIHVSLVLLVNKRNEFANYWTKILSEQDGDALLNRTPISQSILNTLVNGLTEPDFGTYHQQACDLTPRLTKPLLFCSITIQIAPQVITELYIGARNQNGILNALENDDIQLGMKRLSIIKLSKCSKCARITFHCSPTFVRPVLRSPLGECTCAFLISTSTSRALRLSRDRRTVSSLQ